MLSATRTRSHVCILLGLCLLSACAPRVARGPFQSFAAYYDYGRLEELSSYQLLVLQPNAYNPADLALLKSRGATVLAYISLTEDDALRRDDGTGPGGWAPWYLDQFTGRGLARPGADGAPDQNENWGSYYVNPADPRWRVHIARQARAFRRQGFDGLFLDTVLFPRRAFTIDVEESIGRGVPSLIGRLRDAWPRGYFLANNPWDLEETRFMNGVLLENILMGQPNPAQAGEAQKILRLYANQEGIDVITLDELPSGLPARADAWCAEAVRWPFLAVFYPDSPEGKHLKALPLRACGASRRHSSEGK